MGKEAKEAMRKVKGKTIEKQAEPATQGDCGLWARRLGECLTHLGEGLDSMELRLARVETTILARLESKRDTREGRGRVILEEGESKPQNSRLEDSRLKASSPQDVQRESKLDSPLDAKSQQDSKPQASQALLELKQEVLALAAQKQALQAEKEGLTRQKEELARQLEGLYSELQLGLYPQYQALPGDFRARFRQIQPSSLQSFLATASDKHTLISLHSFLKNDLQQGVESPEVVAFYHALLQGYGGVLGLESLEEGAGFDEGTHIRLDGCRGAIKERLLLGFKDGKQIYKSIVR